MVGYHAFPALVPGGFVGVDIFFVISGYLISTILIGEITTHRFSLWGLDSRRIRRLFPALIAVICTTLLLGWFYLLPHEFVSLGKHTAAGASYVINYVLSNEAGYFDAAAETKPLLHLWSLAVEEQYYVIWPIALLALARTKYALAGIAGVTLASFIANLVAAEGSDPAAFFLPQNRVWELSIGAYLSARNAWPSQRFRLVANATWVRLWPHIASVAGICLVVIAILGFEDTMTFPGVAALVPCLGAALIIAAGSEGLLNRNLMALRPLVFVGLISYPLYLWHWPLLAIPAILGVAGRPSVTVAAVVLAIALAVCTYVFLEKPVRRRSSSSLALLLLGGTVVLGATGAAIMTAQLPPRLNASNFHQVGLAIDDWSYPNGLTETDSDGLIVGTASAGEKGILFIGDSHMQQYWPRVAKVLEKHRSMVWVRFATRGGCLPIVNAAIKLRAQHDPECAKVAEAAMGEASRPDIATVVIAASWRGYLGKATPAQQEKLYDALTTMLRRLRSQGKSVWLILQLPGGSSLAPKSSVHRMLDGTVTLRSPSLPRGKADAGWRPISQQLVAIAKAESVGVIDPMGTLCDDAICRGALSDGTLMYKDTGHLRSSIAASHATFIDRIFDAPP